MRKNSVLAAVNDCNRLKKDINKLGYEYSESYFRSLFDNYNTWLKDSTATLVTVSGNSKSTFESKSSSDTHSADSVSTTSNLTSDSSTRSNNATTIIADTTIAKSDTISPSETSVVEEENQPTIAPIIDGFASGDSILFEFTGMYYPGEFLNHTKKGKCSIKYKGMGEKLKTQNVDLQAVYQTSEHPENKDYFGYEIGESANIEVFVTKLNTKVLKPCTIVGLNKNRLVISYFTEDGKERVLSVDKNLIKQ